MIDGGCHSGQGYVEITDASPYVTIDQFKTHIISSVSFVKSIMSFLSSKRNDTTYFVDAVKNITLAFQELREENDDYKFKVDKIIKQTKIKLDI
jgi:hypothetical protein